MSPTTIVRPYDTPRHLDRTMELATIWQNTPVEQIVSLMKISLKKAHEVTVLYQNWSTNPEQQIPAVDAFRGDIYSGLQAASWTTSDREYAHHNLTILSGLYGTLRACDGIMPYRLEMGYKLPDGRSLYTFWSDSLKSCIPQETTHIINLSAVEYTKALLPYLEVPVITPKFLTIKPATGEPTFVTVHTKIARGAFANWLIADRIDTSDQLLNFSKLGYIYRPELSTPEEPVFVCETFQGTGLSVRR